MRCSFSLTRLRVVVVTGSGEFDRYWQDGARQKFGDRYKNLEVAYLTGLTLDGFIAEARKLTARTILLILTVFEDSEGRKYRPRDAVEKIAAASGAPSYGFLSSYVGTGILGGDMGTYLSTGENLASLVARVLSDRGPSPRIEFAASGPVVDWRQLNRWGIDAKRVPQRANILFYTPTTWERYRWQIILAASRFACKCW